MTTIEAIRKGYIEGRYQTMSMESIIEDVERISGRAPAPATVKAQAYRLNASPVADNRTFGIEIEAYNVDRFTLSDALNEAGVPCRIESYGHRTRTHWKIVTDATLNGYSNPFELVSPKLKGKDGLKQIEKVCEVLNRLGAKVGKKCGLHVHHSAYGFNSQSFLNIMRVYQNTEVSIDSIMPKSRRSNVNRYCKSLLGRSSTPNDRYYKVNFEAYQRHGTVEFRQHGGTVDAQKIIKWVCLTQRIMTWARYMTVEETHATWTLERLFEYLSLTSEKRWMTELKAFFIGRRLALA